jgi:CxxC-x17-CxxC domain-containing protein
VVPSAGRANRPRNQRLPRSLLSTVLGETDVSLRPHEQGAFFLYASDKTLACQDCNQEFVFSSSEQQFYADRQFSEPRRCPSCRAARKAQRGDFGGGASHSGGAGGGAGRGYSSGPREMFSATCSSCGREAQVPFRPSGTKPVYCSDCFTTRRA